MKRVFQGEERKCMEVWKEGERPLQGTEIHSGVSGKQNQKDMRYGGRKRQAPSKILRFPTCVAGWGNAATDGEGRH